MKNIRKTALTGVATLTGLGLALTMGVGAANAADNHHPSEGKASASQPERSNKQSNPDSKRGQERAAQVHAYNAAKKAQHESGENEQGDDNEQGEHAPKPVETTPAPAPVETTPAPEPVETTPAPEPVETTPAPAPVETTPADTATPAPTDTATDTPTDTSTPTDSASAIPADSAAGSTTDTTTTVSNGGALV